MGEAILARASGGKEAFNLSGVNRGALNETWSISTSTATEVGIPTTFTQNLKRTSGNYLYNTYHIRPAFGMFVFHPGVSIDLDNGDGTGNTTTESYIGFTAKWGEDTTTEIWGTTPAGKEIGFQIVARFNDASSIVTVEADFMVLPCEAYPGTSGPSPYGITGGTYIVTDEY